MGSEANSIENLQTALAMEMSAINQYLLHAHVLDDWGLDVLAARMRAEMTEELGHAGRFIDRILFLGGDPVVAASDRPRRAASLDEMFSADLADEKNAIAVYTEAARLAGESRDIGTRILFETIVQEEEGHMDWLQRQRNLLARLGEPTFMAQNMSDVTTGG